MSYFTEGLGFFPDADFDGSEVRLSFGKVGAPGSPEPGSPD
jgi:hypothetical protein